MSVNDVPSPSSPSTDRVRTRIGLARGLACDGAATPARQMCGAIFLDHAPLLMRDPALLEAYVGCLLLLEMTALLPRVMRAIYGVGVEIVTLAGREPRRHVLSFSNGRSVAIVSPGLRAERAEREKAAARWSAVILHVAARDDVGEAMPAPAVGRSLEHAL